MGELWERGFSEARNRRKEGRCGMRDTGAYHPRTQHALLKYRRIRHLGSPTSTGVEI